MSFKELIERYKKGDLSEKEKDYVESEIEKNEAINEYMADQLELDLDIKNNELKNIEIDSNKIKEAVNKKFRKVIAISVLTVFIIIFAGKYLVSPIINTFYYNPNKHSIGKYNEDLYFDMRSYVELFLPGIVFDDVDVETLGFGKYNIKIEQKELFNRDNKYTDISLVRNKKYGYFENLHTQELEFKGDEKSKKFRKAFFEQHLNGLKTLPETSYVAAYVDFNKDLSMEQLILLRSKYKSIKDGNEKLDFKWVGIRTFPKEKEAFDQAGFNPNPNDGPVRNDIADNKKYPYLAIIDYYSSMKLSSECWEKEDAKAYEVHFKSLLQYLCDRKEFNSSISKGIVQEDFYKSSLDYIKSNGIKTYGVLVYGEAKYILSFMEDETTDCIFILNIKASKFSKH